MNPRAWIAALPDDGRQALADLKATFAEGTDLERLRQVSNLSAWELILRRHLPLLALLIPAALLCPGAWIFRGGVSLKYHLLAPAFLMGGALFSAVLFDRVNRHSRIESLLPEERLPAHIALFYQLPVCAAGVFFFVHPMVGYAGLFASLAFATVKSLQGAAVVHGLSRALVATRYITALMLIVVPLTLLLFLHNLARSLGILRSLL